MEAAEATGLGRLLRSLGLERYEEVLRANDVDEAALRQLTDADLKELGVSLGHRRKLIAALHDAEAPPPSEAVAAERRQLTVLFCDLVGSTALAAALDPEDMRGLLRAYESLCAAVVQSFDGFLARSVGDGILAYFGYPRADENAAERAVRAGLLLLDEIRRLRSPAGAPLALRIGIASGLVVVSDVARGVSIREHAVTGAIVNVAARLQQDAAPPGALVIAPETHRLLNGLFDTEDLGPQRLKGVPQAVTAYRVVGERRHATRFDAMHRAGLGEIVGREAEVALLRDRWEQAAAAEGQAVLLSGEPGIGKSRLCQALRERIGRAPHTPILCQCSPFHTNSALHPIIAHVTRAAGLAPGDPPAAKLGKLERLLARSGGAAGERLALLASLLSIEAAELPPPPQKRRMLHGLADHLAALAEAAPVLFVVEDAHWIDPTTLEFLTLAIDRIRGARVLVLVTFRPEFQHPWSQRSHVTMLALNRLGRRPCARVVARIAGGARLPEALIDRIVARADGVPLFVEELTRTVIDQGIDQGLDQGTAGGAQAIPATLHDSLRARLDRLAPPARKVAQIGAALGREFSHQLLAGMVAPSDGDWRRALLHLVEAGLLHRRGAPPEAAYTFKHVLVQDVAYASLLRGERAALHARIAEGLARLPEIAATQPELLAHHYTEAGDAERAIAHWLAAGRRAASSSANLEAIGHLTRGLELLPALGDENARRRSEMRLRTALGMPLIAVKGYAAKETGATWERARALAEMEGDAECAVNALYGLWAFHIVGGACETALAIAAQFLERARKGDDPAILLVGERIMGVSLHSMGDQPRGRAMIEAALQRYEPDRHGALAFRFGQDQRVAALAFLSLILWLEGFPEAARRASRESVGYARAIEHANSLGYALAWSACPVAALNGDVAEARQLADALVAHAEKNALDLWRAYGAAYQGWALAAAGAADGLDRFRQAVTRLAEGGGRLRLAEHLGSLARHLGRRGRPAEGLAVVEEALGHVARSGERWCEAELVRVKGTLVLADHGDAAEAEALLQRALAIARRQSARSWELRAATSLAALWRDEGRAAAARDLLGPVYGAFTEGFETADLTAARALLDGLAGAWGISGARRCR